jgi:hypothetical protein
LVNVHAMRTLRLFRCIGLVLLLGLSLPAPAGAIDFSSTPSVLVGNSPVALAAGDFNRDGKADLAFAKQSFPYTITFLLGNGNGTFSVSAAEFNPGFQCISLAAGDFNGDGWTDLALRQAISNKIHLLLNAGNGAFQNVLTPTNIQLHSGNSMTTADFNGDGLADLAMHWTSPVIVNGSASNYLDIRLNPGVPGQTPAAQQTTQDQQADTGPTPAQQSDQNQGNTGQQPGSSTPAGQTGNPLNPNPFATLFQSNPFSSLPGTQNQINIQQYLQNQGITPPTGQTGNPLSPIINLLPGNPSGSLQNQINAGQQSPSGSGSGGQNQGLPVTAVPEIRVISPNGGESWAKGSTQTIRWTHAGDCGNTVSILLWWKTETAQGYKAITPVPVSIGPERLGEYSWTIPTNFPSYNTCKVMVVSSSKPSCKDMSDGFFSIR